MFSVHKGPEALTKPWQWGAGACPRVCTTLSLVTMAGGGGHGRRGLGLWAYEADSISTHSKSVGFLFGEAEPSFQKKSYTESPMCVK